MIQKPVTIGMLTCEQIIVEENTRNVTAVNCFSKRAVRNLPSEGLSFVVFALLADGLGDMELSVVIERLDNDDEVYRIGSHFHFADPLHEVRCVIRIRDCSFPVAGLYQAVLLCDNEMIAHRKIRIVQKEKST